MEYVHYTPLALIILLCLLRHFLSSLCRFEVDSGLLELPLLRILDQLLIALVVECRWSILCVRELLLLRHREGDVGLRQGVVLCD